MGSGGGRAADKPMAEETNLREIQERYAALARETHRRRASSQFLSYATWVRPDYEIAPHLEAIADKLEAVERGEIDRLMIFMPPRHGKSVTSSVIFPAWYIGRNPRREIIACSYGGDLVGGFGARVRNIASGPEHAAVFGEAATTKSDLRARDHWLTKAGGVYRGAGVGAGITGFGAHLMLIDDPVKSREEADSPTIQQRNWDWWRDDAYPRLMPGGAMVLIMTRWSDGDLAGRILDAGIDDWVVLRHPAIDNLGRALWPSRYPEKALARIREAVGERAWSAEYQGRPAPKSGLFFQEDWFQPSPRRFTPEDARRGIINTYGASDYAVTKDGGDYTVHGILGIDQDDNLHILDIWREQETSDVWTDAMIDMIALWRPRAWAEEKGGLQRAAEPQIKKRMKERSTFVHRLQYTSSVNKRERAISFQGRMASKKVFWPYEAGWFAVAKDELLRFDTGKLDDIEDTLSVGSRMLAGMTKGRVPAPTAEESLLGDIYGGGVAGIDAMGTDFSASLPDVANVVTWGQVVEATRKTRQRRRRRRSPRNPGWS